jgi:hypothetical protein
MGECDTGPVPAYGPDGSALLDILDNSECLASTIPDDTEALRTVGEMRGEVQPEAEIDTETGVVSIEKLLDWAESEAYEFQLCISLDEEDTMPECALRSNFGTRQASFRGKRRRRPCMKV